MNLWIPYGREGKLDIDLPDRNLLAVLEPNHVNPENSDPDRILEKSMSGPIGGLSLHEFLKDADRLLVLVNDATRPTPTARVLSLIADEIAPKEPDFLVATGIHRHPTEEEYIQIFGKSNYARFKSHIFSHDARDRDNMVYLGKSTNGTPMSVNKLGARADSILVISSVEPHYFAGYTGGRKSFLPGIAAYDTIEQNHKLALKPEARTLALKGNPVHEDMVDALAHVKSRAFAINTVLDKDHRIFATCSGEIHASLNAAAKKANEIFAVQIHEKADIVISVVKFPGDIDLYQSQKGIDNAKHALKQGGIIILVSQCRDGIGEKAFARLLSSAGSPARALEEIEKEYKLGYHKAAKLAEICLWAEIWAVTDIAPESLEQIYIRPFDSLEQAIGAAIEKKGRDAKLLVLMDGGLTVPVLEKRSGEI
ncbi:MAG: nickel-dependent lactate racemase [Deltaproteobacteria bacterium]|nr:nickel-dependent lactate racemase [Deltaproteobacteria bacterium]